MTKEQEALLVAVAKGVSRLLLIEGYLDGVQNDLVKAIDDIEDTNNQTSK